MPKIDCLNREEYLWNMEYLAKVKDYLYIVEDKDRREMVEQVLDKWNSMAGARATVSRGNVGVNNL